MNVAQTQLMVSIVKEKLSNYVKINEMPDWIKGYIHYVGHPEIRLLIAQFREYHLCNCNINSNTLGLSAGATATVELTVFFTKIQER